MIHHPLKMRLRGASLAVVAIAMGTSGAAAAQELSEVVVTARRVEERLQDVPISITVMTPQEISKRNIATSTDLATYTPSLTTNQRYGPDKASFALRGFSQEIGTAPTVGLYFADVVGVRAQGGTTSGNNVPPGSFIDLQNVQVLKGPQGTLFGRNTTGGAILLVPQRPSDQMEGYVEASVGNYDLRRLQAVVNVPINDTMRLRLSGESHQRDGYLKNTSQYGPKDFNNLNYTYGRASFVWDVTPDIENYSILHYSDSKTHGYANKIVACDTAAAATAPTNANFIRVLNARAGCALIAKQGARGDGVYDVSVNAPKNAEVRQRQIQFINTTTWRVNENLTVKNIASYGEFREKAQLNLITDDFVVPPNFVVAGGLNLTSVGGQPYTLIRLDNKPGFDAASARSFTEELQFQGTALDARLNYVVGGYLEFSRPIDWQSNATGQFLNCTDPGSPQNLSCGNPFPGVGSYAFSRTKPKFDNHGIFAQATFQVTPKFGVTLGGRYTFDKIVIAGESTRFNFNPATGTFIQNCNDVTRFYVKDAAGNPVLVRGSRVSLPVSDAAQCHNEITEKSSKPTWLIEADYKPVDDVMVYAKYARGYRQGGISFTTIGLETWGPEQLDSYEVGAKTSFRAGDMRGSFNIAAFYNNLKDGQVFGSFISRDVSIVSGAPGIINAGKSRIKGVEIDASLTPLEGLRFDLAYAYLDTKILKLVTPTIPTDSPYSAFLPRAGVGDPLNYAPKHRVTLAGTYNLPLPEEYGDLSVGLTFVHTSSQLSEKFTPVYGILPSYDLLNLNVNWDRVLDSPVDLSLFATNIGNEKYLATTGSGWSSFGFADVLYGAPQMYGVRMRVSFGK